MQLKCYTFVLDISADTKKKFMYVVFCGWSVVGPIGPEFGGDFPISIGGNPKWG